MLVCSKLKYFDVKIIVMINLPSHYSTAQAACLIDEPKQTGQYKYPDKLPGQIYDADTQCKWQFGMKAKLCNLSFVKVPIHALLESYNGMRELQYTEKVQVQGSSEAWTISLPYLAWQFALKVLASFEEYPSPRGVSEGNVFLPGVIRGALEST